MAAPSPERQRLATAIADLRAAEKESAGLDAAYLPSLRAQADAEATLAAARKALDTATRAAVDLRVAVLAGGAEAEAAPSIDQARHAVQMAEDDLETAGAAYRVIRQRQGEISEELSQHRYRVENAAKARIWAEAQSQIAALLADHRDAQERLAELRSLLSFFWSIAPAPMPPELRSAVECDLPLQARSASVGETRWREALAALQTDAGAKLPKV